MFIILFASLLLFLEASAISVNFETFFLGQLPTPETSLVIFDREVLKNSKPVIIKFYTKTCGPCVMTKRPYEALSNAYTNRVIFLELDANRFSSISNLLRVSKVPLIICFSQGLEQKRFLGSDGVDQLRSYLARAIPN